MRTNGLSNVLVVLGVCGVAGCFALFNPSAGLFIGGVFALSVGMAVRSWK